MVCRITFLNNQSSFACTWLNGFKQVLLTLIVLFANRLFQVLLFNTSNSIKNCSFICMQLNGSKYCYVILIVQFKSFLCTQLNCFKYRK